MNLSTLSQRFQKVLKQRNQLVPLVLLLSVSQIILICLLFFKEEKIVFLPPQLEKPFSLDGRAYSPAYYEQMGVYLSSILLTKSGSTAEGQVNLLLKHVDPSVEGVFRRDLVEEAEVLKKENMSYVFFPKITHVNFHKHSVKIDGEMHAYVGDSRISTQKESYRFIFKQRGHLLYLLDFQKEKTND